MKPFIALVFSLLFSTAASAEQIGLKCDIPGTGLDGEWHILVDTARHVYAARLDHIVFREDESAEVLTRSMRLAIKFGARRYWLILGHDNTAYTSQPDGSMMKKAGRCEEEPAMLF